MKILDLARSSNEPGGIDTMRARPSHLSGLAVLLGAMLPVMFFAACRDGPTAPLPTTITVSPATADLTALGATVQLSAEVWDENGQPMVGAGAAVTWASSAVGVAMVSASGLVTAVAIGSATITATLGLASAGVAVTVLADRDALVALYNATDGPNWVDNTNWLSGKPIGEWYGVSTDADGRVVRLDLGGEGLTGPLPPELSNLASLLWLDLSGNGLTGVVPPELGNLSNLSVLYLHGNSLTGEIPPELGNLSNLSVLWLHDNSLTGEIPSSFLAIGSLSDLYFQDNNGLCAPNTSAFDRWLNGIDSWSGPRCD